MLKLWNEGKNGTYKSSGKAFRKAYMPFITKLTTTLLELAKRSSEVAELLKNEPLWEAYVNGDYKLIVTNESKQLGGGPDKKDSEDEQIAPEPTGEINIDTKESAEPETKYHDTVVIICRTTEGEGKTEAEVELQLPTKEEKLAKQKAKEGEEEKKEEEKKPETVVVAEEKKEPSKPVVVEEPLQSEYAANNYWRADINVKDIDKLELEYA
ncbi:MAG: hypothetical protein P4L10_17390 [Acidobacteriaceae bacterium]|nr:hypothetical protein [Acidobacteriaceae bacterium]